MYGKALRGIDRADLKEIGVKTMGRRFLLLEEIKALLSSNSSLNSTGKVKLPRAFVVVMYFYGFAFQGRMLIQKLTHYTLTSACTFSILFSLRFLIK